MNIFIKLYTEACDEMCQKMELHVIHTQQTVHQNKNTARVDILFSKDVQVNIINYLSDHRICIYHIFCIVKPWWKFYSKLFLQLGVT